MGERLRRSPPRRLPHQIEINLAIAESAMRSQRPRNPTADQAGRLHATQRSASSAPATMTAAWAALFAAHHQRRVPAPGGFRPRQWRRVQRAIADCLRRAVVGQEARAQQRRAVAQRTTHGVPIGRGLRPCAAHASVRFWTRRSGRAGGESARGRGNRTTTRPAARARPAAWHATCDRSSSIPAESPAHVRQPPGELAAHAGATATSRLCDRASS